MEGEDSNIVDPLFNFCRLCIVEEGKFIVLPRSHIQNSIRKIFGVTIKPFDGFSRLLCEACKKQLLDIERIRDEYLLNQEILHTLKKSHDQARQNPTNTTIKTEPEDEVPEHTASDCEMENTSSPPAEEPTTKATENNVVKDIKEETNDLMSEKSTSDSEIDNTDTANPANTDRIQVDKDAQNTKQQSPAESNLPTSKLTQASTDGDYRYHCRMCNDQFETFVKLKVHLGDHSNLMRLQRRFTPYVCSVRLEQLVKTDQVGSTHIQFRKHPFFFVRIMRNKYPDNTEISTTEAQHTNEDSDSEDGNQFAPSEDMSAGSNSPFNLNKYEEESPTGIFEPTIPYNHDSLNLCDFGSILREVYSVLDYDQDVNTTLEVNEGLINEYIQQRYNKYCRNEAMRELQQAQHILIYICKKRLKVHWKQSKNRSIETVLHFSPFSENLQNSSNLEGFVEISKKTVNNSVAKKRVTLSNQSVRTSNNVSARESNTTEKGGAREVKATTSPSSAAKRVTLSNQSVRTSKDVSLRASNTTEEGSAREVKAKTSPGIAAKKVTLANQSVHTYKDVSVRASNTTEGGARELKATTSPGCTNNAMDNVMNVGHVCSVMDVMGKGENSTVEVSGTGGGNSSADEVTSVTLDTNSTVIADVTIDATGSVDGSSPAEALPPDWPVIVSTTTLESSACAAGTDAIDLDGDQHTITSDYFQEPVSPIVFFQHVLEKEGLYLSPDRPSQQAISLVCFKKNVENRGDFVINISIDNYRSFFYLEVWQGKNTIDLTNENFLTQWSVLTSISRPNVETLMNNYAKRFAVNVGIVAKFIKIIRSISGTIRGDSVLMEAPNTFFF